MKKFFLAVCLTTLWFAPARAADPPPSIQLNKKSSFDAVDVRDPFWPIGWKKPTQQSGSSEIGPALTPESFSLTSVTMGAGPHFAILNGKIMQEGQQFGLALNREIYQVTLRTIADGQVILTYQGGEIVVPLRRK